MAEQPLPESQETARSAGNVVPLLEDTSPEGIPAISAAAASADTADSLFEEAAPELIAASGADPFADFQEAKTVPPSSPNRLELIPAAAPASSAPANSDGATDQEWLFSEPGEETASLLAQVTPLEQEMIAQQDPSDDPLLEAAAPAGLDLQDALPELHEAPVVDLHREAAAEIPAPCLTTLAGPLVPGQIQYIVLVIDGRTYRLQLQLERMD